MADTATIDIRRAALLLRAEQLAVALDHGELREVLASLRTLAHRERVAERPAPLAAVAPLAAAAPTVAAASTADGGASAQRDVGQEDARALEAVIAELEAQATALHDAAVALQRDDPSPADARGHDAIADAVTTLHGLRHDLVDHLGLRGGELLATPAPFSPRAMVASVVDALRGRAASRQWTLTWRAEGALPEQVAADPGRVRQVVQTLGAVALSGDGPGALTLCVAVGTESEPWTLRVRYARHDSGMAAAAPPALAAPGGRSALTLSVSRRVVEQLGGRLWLGDADGARGVLHLELPVAPAAPTTLQRGDATAAVGVVVLAHAGEADPAVASALSDAGCAVVDCADAVAVAAALRREPRPAALVLDGELSGDGPAAVRALLQLPGASALPKLLLARRGQRGDAAFCRSFDIGAYLVQPASARDLRDALATVAALAPAPRRRGQVTGGGALVTRHLLRESRAKLRIGVRGVVDVEVTDALADLGHDVVDGREPSALDVLILDVRDAGADARESVHDALADLPAEGRPSVLVIMGEAGAARGVERDAPVDDIVLAPVDARRLQAALSALRRVDGGAARRAPASLDREGLRRRLGGDDALVTAVAAAFARDVPRLQAEAMRALVGGDLAQAGRNAAAIASALTGLGLEGSAAAARALAAACTHGRSAVAIVDARVLAQRLAPVLPAMTAIGSAAADSARPRTQRHPTRTAQEA